jgi:hypothetical protein
LRARTAEVIREHSGGGWRYVIDDPFAEKL